MVTLSALATTILFGATFNVKFGSISGVVSTSGNIATVSIPGMPNKQYTEEAFGWPKLFMGDVSGDGNWDFIAINGNYCKVIPGINGGGFQTITGTNTVAYAFMNEIFFNWPYIRISDINGDGRVDLVAMNSNNEAYVVPGRYYLNSGYVQGRFDVANRYYEVQPYFSWPWRDIGQVDALSGGTDFVAIQGTNIYTVPGIGITSGCGSTTGSCTAKLDWNNRKFASQVFFAWSDIRLLDIDGDGFQDIFATGSPDQSDAYVVPGGNGIDVAKRAYMVDAMFTYRNKIPLTITNSSIYGGYWTLVDQKPLICNNNTTPYYGYQKYSVRYAISKNQQGQFVATLAERNPVGDKRWTCNASDYNP